MNEKTACVKCEKIYTDRVINGKCDCGGRLAPICEKLECNKPGTHYVYGAGYIANVCKEHYMASSPQDRADANRFYYTE